MYVEYKSKDRKDFRDFGGRINLGRNYRMFGLLSKGVRSDLEQGVEPKGMPDYETLAFASRNDYQNFIDKDGGENYVTPEQAERWVRNGSSIYTDETKRCVSNPDWHSHSWLTVDEYEKVLSNYYSFSDSGNWKEPEYDAILAAMQSLAEEHDVRLVFWFDN